MSIMKPTRKLLFLLCPMLVLGFIYYSSGKLHLHVWGQKPDKSSPQINDSAVAMTVRTAQARGRDKAKEPAAPPKKAKEPVVETLNTVGQVVGPAYDKQGFLLTLDGKLSQELIYKYGNLSEGACKPGYVAAKMTAIYPKFTKPAPMFLDKNFKRLGKVSVYSPPFGFKTQERVIDIILTATKNYGLGTELDSLSCKRCIIVGNGGILANKSLGSQIDEYDVVVRLNEAPVNGFQKDVGSKTTIRITYPEGAIQKPERYEKDSLFVFSAFKPQDFRWLRQMVFKEKLRTEGFWKSVAHHVPKDPSDMRILNPYFIQEAAFQFIGLPLNNGIMGRGNIPTLGTVAITMALHNCDEVAVAGFGYDMNTPHAPLHYYETVKMSAIKESWTHNISKEKEFLRKLVKAKVITDMTNGI
ncbi:ST3 beta-galactoside alpha-2,3-sialyltransferase 3b isoform X4 [Anguilla rostrata]|uniref:ST3 beta-galactoside alpha-2,3-sialyltransferase 3b isoform X1 n=1 Tax=Anguilla anguilla TaxID=7936 RepID=UPI0015A83CFC|nr:ST3 beta-galactoside alpha-2,3-sialyltransferase 3b isoform X1 [Anguilla anguilla]XP_035277153.1 ST3 beta-galactoside alpha-2,3-sialyltransferase 3b isoform X1 [Anguilla anguilla]XP_035277154.1 ST3 beta-galactoside alpha-2,3-sialyltransferase 3b isoform X1 [Anguilla anguilla]XP_035277156.1 ST3 beta-galactoside alpha-2,3-sialyltransferase 3b isoform X1 [Anguilla anguilla]XP_035277157.1 ST3 beta-galactoside alpha-2,3-sialyltransferase 3b isoform X1 [Anguilla anguilla]XP_035277158.1 ST3 beta-g